MLRVARANLEIQWNFFTIRAAKKWNEVPDRVKSQRTVSAFKSAYDEWRNNNSLPETANLAIEREATDDVFAST